MDKQRMTRQIVLALCLGVAAGGAQLGIAQAAAAETEDLEAYDLGETVVTATKTKLAEKKVPMSTQVITQKEIKETGAYNVRDVLKTLAGLNVMEAGMTGNMVSIRGMGTSSTLILVDGRRMSGEDSGSTMNVYELNRVNLQDVERIEVIRGSGSGLYGSDAMGGVINIITKKNQKEGGYAGTQLGSRESSVYGGYSTGDVGKLNLNFNYNLTEIRKQDENGDTNMYGPKRYFNFQGNYRFNDHSGLDFGASFLKEQYRSLTLGTTSASDMTEWYDNNRADYHVKYYGFDKKNDYEIQTYYNRLGKESRKRTSSAWQDFDHAKYETFVVEGKNTYRPNTQHTLTYGAEYRKQKAGGTRLGAGASNPYTETYLGMSKTYSSASVESYAAYLQDEWQLSDKLFFVPSIRFDHHESFGGEWSPRAGLTYNLSQNARIKTNYGFGYRAPSIFELYSHMDRNMGRMQVQVWGNSELEAEKSRTFDIGLEAEKGKSTGKLTYFHNKISNMIDSEFLGRFGRAVRYRYVNINKAVMDGVEGEYGYRFDKHWDVKLNFTYLDAKDGNTNARLTGHTRMNGLVELNWTDAKPNPWTASLYNMWYKDYLDGEGKNYTYSTTNFVVTKDLNKNTHIYAGVDNLFNKTFSYEDAFSIYGRTWRAGVEFKF